MASRYEVGEKIIITPVQSQPMSPRDSDLGPYAGQTGEVVDYHWISPNAGEVFYLYTVRVGSGDKEVVLHEDEIEPIKV